MSLTIITLNSPQLTDFAKERNTALAQAKTDWVLFVDSDEVVTPALKKEIDFAIQSSRFTAYYLPRRDTFLGKTVKPATPNLSAWLAEILVTGFVPSMKPGLVRVG